MKPAVVAAIAATVSLAKGDVYLTQPIAEFEKSAANSSWVAEFPPPWPGTFATGAQFAGVARAMGYKSLRAFLEGRGPACGNSLPNAKAKPIPSDNLIKFDSSMKHPGPWEVWFDDSLVFHEDDCEKSFGTAKQFNVDFTGCKDSCLLRFYWLGLQDGGKHWQSYKNCVPLGKDKTRSIKDENEGEDASSDGVDGESPIYIEAINATEFTHKPNADEPAATTDEDPTTASTDEDSTAATTDDVDAAASTPDLVTEEPATEKPATEEPAAATTDEDPTTASTDEDSTAATNELDVYSFDDLK